MARAAESVCRSGSPGVGSVWPGGLRLLLKTGSLGADAGLQQW